MVNYERKRLSSLVIRKAMEFGASMCGIISVDALKKGPSTVVGVEFGKTMLTHQTNKYGLKPGEVFWPEDGKSVIVIAVEHPESKPELDWWFGDVNPPGNRILIDINKKIVKWLSQEYPEIKAYPLAYHTEKGGIYLKDAAVLSGLGCIGKNNLLLTPQYGSQVRLRAIIVSEELSVTGPIEFDPCVDCEQYCIKACPMKAFDETVWTKETLYHDLLPGRYGNYSRPKCKIRIDKDEEIAAEELIDLRSQWKDYDTRDICSNIDAGNKLVKIIKYCRVCEFACPVGKSTVK